MTMKELTSSNMILARSKARRAVSWSRSFPTMILWSDQLELSPLAF